MNGSQRGRVSTFFGQFAEGSFYVELAQTAIREVIKAAALAFAGALTMHVGKKFQGQLPMDQYPGNPSNPNNSASAASRAFGVTDTTNYNRPVYNPSNHTGAQSFPGFGSR